VLNVADRAIGQFQKWTNHASKKLSRSTLKYCEKHYRHSLQWLKLIISKTVWLLDLQKFDVYILAQKSTSGKSLVKLRQQIPKISC